MKLKEFKETLERLQKQFEFDESKAHIICESATEDNFIIIYQKLNKDELIFVAKGDCVNAFVEEVLDT